MHCDQQIHAEAPKCAKEILDKIRRKAKVINSVTITYSRIRRKQTTPVPCGAR